MISTTIAYIAMGMYFIAGMLTTVFIYKILKLFNK